MTYDEFIEKWCKKYLYDDNLVHSFAGNVQLFRNKKYTLSYSNAVVDLFWTPKWHGWANDKQRREFYKDAKSVGVIANKKTKNEWYKIKDLI